MDLDMNEKETAARFSLIFFFHFCLCILCASSSLCRFRQTSEKQTNKTLKAVCMSSIITCNVRVLGSIIIIMCVCFFEVFFFSFLCLQISFDT